MLTLIAFAMLASFVVLLMTRRLSALTALILVPTAFALLTGHTTDIGKMVADGIKTVAPTGLMLIFAMLYFLTMTEAKMFDPLVNVIVRLVKGDPVKVLIGTVALAFMVALDGDGATVYMIVLSAMLPLYRRMGMNIQRVAALLLLCTGLGNMLPWGGPTARAAASMRVGMDEVFTPLSGAMLFSVAWVFLLAWRFGVSERARVGKLEIEVNQVKSQYKGAELVRLILNWLITIMLILILILNIMPLTYLFMVGTAIALVINFPELNIQREVVGKYGAEILSVSTLIFAASVFTGVLSGTGMADAFSTSVVSIIPDALGPYLAVVTALLSIPLTWLLSNDAFYFGVLPILQQAAAHYGISAAEMARASLIGQPVHILSPFVASTYLLVGMLELDYASTQRYVIKWALISSIVMLIAALILGIIPLHG